MDWLGSRDQRSALPQARRAVGVLLLAQGAAGGAWATRLPSIQDKLHLDPGTLGLALVGQPLGLIVAVQLVPRLVRRWSSAQVARWSMVAAALAIILPALAWSAATLFTALLLVGVMFGTSDVSVNVQAVAVEHGYGRPVMSRLHAHWSAGLLLGSLTASVAAAAGIEPLIHLAVVAVCLAGLAFVGGAGLLGAELGAEADQETNPDPPEGATTDRETDPDPAEAGEPPPGAAAPRPDARIVLAIVATVAFCSLLVEGSVTDWSGVFLHSSQHASLGVAALGVAVYSVGTIIGRLAGDSLITRLGRMRTLRRTAALAGVGLTIAVIASSPAVALGAYGILGLGVSMIVPIAFSSAGRIVGVPAVRALARVTTTGYAGSFIGPATIGVVASGTGLADALLIPVALLFLIVPLSVALDRSGFQA